MATVTLGNIKLNWKGAYNAGTAYAIDDVVSYNGSSYVAKQLQQETFQLLQLTGT